MCMLKIRMRFEVSNNCLVKFLRNIRVHLTTHWVFGGNVRIKYVHSLLLRVRVFDTGILRIRVCFPLLLKMRSRRMHSAGLWIFHTCKNRKFGEPLVTIFVLQFSVYLFCHLSIYEAFIFAELCKLVLPSSCAIRANTVFESVAMRFFHRWPNEMSALDMHEWQRRSAGDSERKSKNRNEITTIRT